MDNNLSYKHVQHAPLCLLLSALAAVFSVLGWVLKNERQSLRLFGLLMLALATSFPHLTVEDTRKRLVISFGYIRRLHRSLRCDDICGVEAGRTSNLDGWGIHWSLRGVWV